MNLKVPYHSCKLSSQLVKLCPSYERCGALTQPLNLTLICSPQKKHALALGDM